MRQDFFEFEPAFKLIITGNHKPGLRSVDEAMRRRFHLIPFAAKIPAEKRDPKLIEKLNAELPGILSWMIQGCLDWQKQGLSPPPAVKSATDEYLSAEDLSPLGFTSAPITPWAQRKARRTCSKAGRFGRKEMERNPEARRR